MFLDALTQKEMNKVESSGIHKIFKAGESIIEEGDNGTSFSLILMGRVEVRKRLAVGQHKSLIELGPCDLVGELGFLGAESRTASVVAVTDSELLEFSREAFQKVVDAYPMIGAKVYRGIAEVLAKRLTSNDETLMDTIFWALGRSANKMPNIDINIANRRKLTLKQ
ncbi:MAG: hypothetical protein A2283_14590 [Lentisphaerae bacterium RIFOXYA12_FULL_48_11]|nr:MAG: hypothetical protein A2283_14590 [Lentisphaerae bacterium RIFOXYA12_FULL_48_11]